MKVDYQTDRFNNFTLTNTAEKSSLDRGSWYETFGVGYVMAYDRELAYKRLVVDKSKVIGLGKRKFMDLDLLFQGRKKKKNFLFFPQFSDFHPKKEAIS
jgi:hypothetical protein